MLRGLCYSRALIIFRGDEFEALPKLQREAPKSPFVFEKLRDDVPKLGFKALFTGAKLPSEWKRTLDC
ncbi:MAG: hypothetical protein WBW13_10020 [Pseudolabrys sp.]